MSRKSATIVAVLLVAVLLVLLIAGCGTTEAPQADDTTATTTEPVTAREATAQDCPDLGGPSDLPAYADFNLRYGIDVTFVNNTTRTWVIEVPPVDCYDFSGTANPTRYDGAVLAPAGTSGPHTLVARRTCPWIGGEIIGYFQTREAIWTTTYAEQGGSEAEIATSSTIACNTFGRTENTMCSTGVSQDRDVRIFDLPDGGAIRQVTACAADATTVTFDQLY